jgi:molybdopterin converting factor small subunit
MQIHIPTPLRSYTRQSIVQANGATLAELLNDLERQFPGIRFRMINEQDEIREHIKIFVNQRIVQDLREQLKPDDQVRLIMAISGGASRERVRDNL